jgi:hypothetical protein
MTSMADKKDFILQFEERLAFDLSREVLEAPKLNFWVIFIPIFLVYHVFQHKRVVEGRKSFARNYLASRRRALDESADLVRKVSRPEIPEIVRDSELPVQARGPFKELLTLLVEHYTDLLRAEGDDFETLVRSAYKSRANYLLFLNRLNQCERGLNKALMPQFKDKASDVSDVMKKMEVASEKLQRERAARIFAQ